MPNNNNSFAELYNYCQQFEPKISRKLIKEKALELTGTKKIAVVKSGLDVDHCRGLYLSATNTEARIVQQIGSDVIVLARDLNYCWERFVFTKELMHIFDQESETTSSPELFEGLLADLDMSSALERSQQMISEIKGFWMALACLCPEKHRQDFANQKAKGHLDDYGIALQLRIPQQYVPSLFAQNYAAIVAELTKSHP